jgi:hypothetical protein
MLMLCDFFLLKKKLLKMAPSLNYPLVCISLKVPSEELELAVIKIGDSLTMIAGEGDFGNLLFRNCTPTQTYTETCPTS